MKIDEDYMGADAVARWLIDNGVTSEEFKRDPNRWLTLAINAVKNQQEKRALDEAGTIGGSTTASIKGFFESPIKRKRKKKSILKRN